MPASIRSAMQGTSTSARFIALISSGLLSGVSASFNSTSNKLLHPGLHGLGQPSRYDNTQPLTCHGARSFAGLPSRDVTLSYTPGWRKIDRPARDNNRMRLNDREDGTMAPGD
jgi:hypothetical protein